MSTTHEDATHATVDGDETRAPTGNAFAYAAEWEAAGRRIAPMLGSYASVLVVGENALAAAYVALGIGKTESAHRRVAIGDLVGDFHPLQSLVTSDDPHGISDSFAYGVSLNKVAQQIDTVGNLFIMPSGTGDISDPAIYQNVRWQRLANGFREVGALLLLVAPVDAPHLRDLINQMDGVVLAGNPSLSYAPYINIVARVPAPLPKFEKPRVKEKAKGPPIWLIVLLMFALLAIAAICVYWGLRSAESSRSLLTPTPPRPTPLIQAETLSVAPPANPQDSLRSAQFAVELQAWNRYEDALRQLQTNQLALNGGTISPVPIGLARETYYKVIAGAFTTEADAERMLDALREDGVTKEAPGTVVRTPYALLLDSAEAGHTQTLVDKYAGAPFTVYVLVQPNGSLKLYSGAFERPEDSATLIAAIRASLRSKPATDTLHPVLVYRTGRLP